MPRLCGCDICIAHLMFTHLSQLSDFDLVCWFRVLVIEERERLVLGLQYIAELDRRKYFYHYSSLKEFLIEEHRFEEWKAERMVRMARVLNRFPQIAGMLESGALNITLLEIALGCAY